MLGAPRRGCDNIAIMEKAKVWLAALVGMGFALSVSAAPSDMAARVKACAGCHGDEGRSLREGHYPSIAGKPAGYLWQQLLNFRDNRRSHAVMQQMLAYLSDDYLLAIAEYYEAQTPPVVTPTSTESEQVLAHGRRLVEVGDTARGIPACSACHGDDLLGSKPAIPGLIGLPRDYLSAQMGAWRSGVRQAAAPDCMARIVDALSESDITAATAWIASRPSFPDQGPAEQAPSSLPMECGGVP